ncbi:MAG: hydrogenase maturation nickel metallochaperone HypA [Thermodesulfobacteriota bacterium]
MHEMGIALQIIDIAKAAIPPEMKDSPVEQVNLKIGKLAAVVPEYLEFCFGAAARDTPLAGAAIAIEEIPAASRCRSCSHQWEIEGEIEGKTPGEGFKGGVSACPACKSGDLEIISGRELDVVSIDIAD